MREAARRDSPSNGELLDIQDLRTHFFVQDGTVKAVDGVSFSIPDGKTLGVGGIRGDAELQKDLIGLGARFLIAGSDVTYLMTAARQDAGLLRALAPPMPTTDKENKR